MAKWSETGARANKWNSLFETFPADIKEMVNKLGRDAKTVLINDMVDKSDRLGQKRAELSIKPFAVLRQGLKRGSKHQQVVGTDGICRYEAAAKLGGEAMLRCAVMEGQVKVGIYQGQEMYFFPSVKYSNTDVDIDAATHQAMIAENLGYNAGGENVDSQALARAIAGPSALPAPPLPALLGIALPALPGTPLTTAPGTATAAATGSFAAFPALPTTPAAPAPSADLVDASLKTNLSDALKTKAKVEKVAMAQLKQAKKKEGSANPMLLEQMGKLETCLEALGSISSQGIGALKFGKIPESGPLDNESCDGLIVSLTEKTSEVELLARMLKVVTDSITIPVAS